MTRTCRGDRSGSRRRRVRETWITPSTPWHHHVSLAHTGTHSTMAPPLHVKAIAGIVNSMVLIAGIRNVAAPGMALPIIPEDSAFQDHFHDGSRKVEFLFQMLGVCFCAMAFNKLVAVFTTPESTFLRQKLFLTYGLCDLAMAAVVAQYKGLPMSVTGGFAAMHAVEGAAFLHDALMRKRAVKKAAGKKK